MYLEDGLNIKATGAGYWVYDGNTVTNDEALNTDEVEDFVQDYFG